MIDNDLIDTVDSDDYNVIVMMVCCDCDDELLCRRLRKTMMIMMMMIYVCVLRYKYVCVHYQFRSPY